MTSLPQTSTDPALYLPLEDEKCVTFELDGMNESPTVTMLGWTKNIPIQFPGLKEDLNVKTVNVKDKQSTWPKNFKPDLRAPKTLKKFEQEAQGHNMKILNPVYITILGKKSIHTIVKDGKLVVLGNLLIGDDTGFCILNAANNAVQTLYRQVNVGDRLYIGDGTFKHKYISPFATCLDEGLHLNLELKVTHYQCRNVFRLVDPENTSKIPRMFTGGRYLKIPSSLDGNLHTMASPKSEYFDILGVVSYAGRIERLWNYQWRLDSSSAEDGLQEHTCETYTTFRWLELVDADIQTPVPITLFMNQSMWEMQASITPGSAIIITNVCRTEKSYWHPKLKSSVFSQIFVNEHLGQYFKMMPEVAAEASMKLFGSGRMKEILERGDIKWSAGGLYAQPFASEFDFCRLFNDKLTIKKLQRIPKLPFVQREGQRIYFKGTIVKYRAFNGTTTLALWASKNIKLQTEMLDYKRYPCRNPFLPKKGNWHAFTQELPVSALDLNDIPKEWRSKRTRFNNFVCEALRSYCGPLLMPPGTDMSLKDLPIIDGPPYYWIMFADPELRHRYSCIWKPSRYLDFDQMTAKLENAQEKSLIGMIDIHCVDEKACDTLRYEVFLQDFTTITTITALIDATMNNVVSSTSSSDGRMEVE